jgi:Rrf2 family protein
MSLIDSGPVRISAKSDYAIRALVEIATHGRPGHALTAESISAAQGIPLRFLLNILADLRRVGLVDSRRGPDGGWWLARPAEEITVADAIRAVDGPLVHVASVHDAGHGVANALSLSDVWLAVRSSVRDVLEGITVADLAAPDRAPIVRQRAGDDDADEKQSRLPS